MVGHLSDIQATEVRFLLRESAGRTTASPPVLYIGNPGSTPGPRIMSNNEKDREFRKVLKEVMEKDKEILKALAEL